MSSLIKSNKEIAAIREGGKILHGILQRTAELAKPGVSTWELNEFAEREMVKAGGKPAFKGYGARENPFPAGLCTSINDEVVHGVPSKKKILQEGDIIGLDAGLIYKGFYTDTAITVPVGKVRPELERLLSATKLSLEKAIEQARAGNRIGDIGFATQQVLEKAGFGVVRDLVGHGVGYAVHEDPQVPGYGQRGTGMILKKGMVLAIEPMATTGDYHLKYEDDGWTISTVDGGYAAHFEHTVAITDGPAEILT